MRDFYDEDDSPRVEASNIIYELPGRIEVHVESEADVPFWFFIFEKYAPGLHVEIMPGVRLETNSGQEPQRDRGKPVLLSFVNVGPKRLVCVDSDYHYLIPNATANATAINESPYIFQTYTYSIENYKCWAESLGRLCVDASYNAEMKMEFDFVQFLQEYSEVVYSLFLYSVYSEKNTINRPITRRKRVGECATLEGKPSLRENGREALQKLKNKVEETLEEVDAANPEINLVDEVLDLGIELEEKRDVTPDNVYLFINGHALSKGVVVPTMKQVVDRLIKGKRKQLATESPDSEKRKTALCQYNEKVYDPERLLNVNRDFLDCPLIDKIKQDIEVYLDKHPVTPPN
jgi:hypothetical protein